MGFNKHGHGEDNHHDSVVTLSLNVSSGYKLYGHNNNELF